MYLLILKGWEWAPLIRWTHPTPFMSCTEYRALSTENSKRFWLRISWSIFVVKRSKFIEFLDKWDGGDKDLLSIALVFFCNIWGRGTIIDLNNSQSHQESPKSSCGVLSQFLNIANIAQEGELFPRVICFSWQPHWMGFFSVMAWLQTSMFSFNPTSFLLLGHAGGQLYITIHSQIIDPTRKYIYRLMVYFKLFSFFFFASL